MPEPSTTTLPPLSPSQRSLLAAFRASGYDLDAAARIAIDPHQPSDVHDPQHPLSLAEALADPALLPWLEHLLRLDQLARDQSEATDRTAARAALRDLIKQAPNPVEARRAATTLLGHSRPPRRPAQVANPHRPSTRHASPPPSPSPHRPDWYAPPGSPIEASQTRPHEPPTPAEPASIDVPTALDPSFQPPAPISTAAQDRHDSPRPVHPPLAAPISPPATPPSPSDCTSLHGPAP